MNFAIIATQKMYEKRKEKCDNAPLKSPAIITSKTTLRFRRVKTVLRRVDSLAPMAIAQVNIMVTVKAKISG